MIRRIQELRTGIWHLRAGGIGQYRQWRHRQRTEQRFVRPGNARGVEGAWTGRGRKRRLTFAESTMPARPPRRDDVRVGVILDRFSAGAFAYEWSTVALDPYQWPDQLSQTPIDLLFVESAWAGNDGLWRGKLAGPEGPHDQLIQLVHACRAQRVPTVFWNKEDPPHYADFLATAALFDRVFTSDAGRVPAYRRDLGHDRIDVLPFAAQPAIHNPIRPKHGWHSRDVAFAGMYFAHKYPERRGQMRYLLGGALDASPRLKTGLDIFSRQLGGDPQYQFPAPLDTRVVGTLNYAQMLSAYRAYRVFLNVNSVVDSPSMCARRIFEISASGTPVISGDSAAISRFFEPDEVPVARTRDEARQLTRALASNDEFNARTVHKAQRRIWAGHTYSHRAETVLRHALPTRARDVSRPTISALVSTMRPQQVEHVFRTLANQRHVDSQLVLVTHGFELSDADLATLKSTFDYHDVTVQTASPDVLLGDCLNRCIDAADGEILTKMDDDDHYGAEYLSDQSYALDYSGADIVGKQAHYMHLAASGATLLRFAEREHRFTTMVMGPTIMARREAMAGLRFPSRQTGEDTGLLRSAVEQGLSIYSSDRFNYYQVRQPSGHTWAATDLDLLASGELKFYGNPDQHIDI